MAARGDEDDGDDDRIGSEDEDEEEEGMASHTPETLVYLPI